MSRLICIFILVVIIQFFMGFGCGKPPIVTPENIDQLDFEVARFDPDYSLTVSELFNNLYNSQFLLRGGVAGDSLIKDFLDSLLVDTLAGIKAKDFDLTTKWGQYRTYKIQVRDLMVRTFWDEVVFKHTTADSLEIVQFYHDSAHFWSVKEQVNLYHILSSPVTWLSNSDSATTEEMSTEERWEQARENIYNLYQMLKLGEAFENVAYDYSHDVTSRAAGGHMGWTTRGKYFDPFDSTAFSLSVGEFCEPYMDKDGWHILYVAGHLDAGPVPIDSPGVFGSVQQTLLTAKSNVRIAEIYDSLNQDPDIVVNEAVIDTNIYYVEPAVWAAVVNGVDTIDVQRLRSLEIFFRKKYHVDSTTAEIRHEMIKAAAQPYLVLQAARDKGFDTLLNIVESREHLWHAKCKSLILQEKYGTDFVTSESALRAYYDKHIDQYVAKKPLAVEHLIVQDSALAEFLREQAITGIGLVDIYNDYGKGQGYKIKYEHLGDIDRNDVEDAFYRAAIRHRDGNIGDLAKTTKGYHVIKVLEHRRSVGFGTVKGSIRRILKNQHKQQEFNKFRDALYARYNVVFPKKLSTVELPSVVERNKSPR